VEHTDGLVTSAAPRGHVDVHEAVDVDWSSKHRLVQKLHKDG